MVWLSLTRFCSQTQSRLIECFSHNKTLFFHFRWNCKRWNFEIIFKIAATKTRFHFKLDLWLRISTKAVNEDPEYLFDRHYLEFLLTKNEHWRLKNAIRTKLHNFPSPTYWSHVGNILLCSSLTQRCLLSCFGAKLHEKRQDEDGKTFEVPFFLSLVFFFNWNCSKLSDKLFPLNCTAVSGFFFSSMKKELVFFSAWR